jgi:hypothetical protein
VPKSLPDTITDTAEFVMSVSSVAGLRVGGMLTRDALAPTTPTKSTLYSVGIST